MKMLIAALVLLLPSVSFADLMMMQNQGGGFVVLSKESCPLEHDDSKPLYLAVTTSETLQVPGCWFFQDMTVHVIWFQQGQDPVEAEYPVLNFEFVASDKK
jgi:hypothetical protein